MAAVAIELIEWAIFEVFNSLNDWEIRCKENF